MSPRAGTDGRKGDGTALMKKGNDKSTVLVTGGTGFLGRWVVDHLVDAGHRVRVLARGKSPSLEERGAEVVVGDVARDLEGAAPLADAFDGVSALFHLAGFVSRDPDDGQRMMRLHVDGTRRILEVAAAAKVKPHPTRSRPRNLVWL